MFKYDEFPEIKKAYREHKRLTRISCAAAKKTRPNDEASKLPWNEAHTNLVAFNYNLFAQIVFNTFKEKAPKLYNYVKDTFFQWDQVFPDTWEKCNEELAIDLLGLVLEIGYGVYWLPDEYYDDRPIDGCLPVPPTHTKPFKSW